MADAGGDAGAAALGADDAPRESWRRPDLRLEQDPELVPPTTPGGTRPPMLRRTATAGTPGMRSTVGGRMIQTDPSWRPAAGGPVLQSVEYQLAEAAAVSRAFAQPQVHLLGEIIGGEGFPSGVSCKWAIEVGAAGARDAWSRSEGLDSGQTQTDYPDDDGDDDLAATGDGGAVVGAASSRAVWAHPIDVSYQAGSLKGWPRLTLEVWHLDEYGRLVLCGYGFTHLPMAPGSYRLRVPTWRPIGSPEDERVAHFLGNTRLLERTSLVSSLHAERSAVPTVGSGTVIVELSILTRNLELHGVDVR